MTAGCELTVLVHGLWVHGVLMQLQRRYLARMGFNAVCYSYPTVRLTLTENAARLARFSNSLGASRIHWVGHSMGGIVILRMLESEPALPPGRVVLQAPPYRGSYAARALCASVIGARMAGRSLREWLTADKPSDFPGRDIGVIAGSHSVGLGRLVAPGLPTPNDGAVTVAETDIEAARDRIILPVSHSAMVLSRRVARQTAAFLRDGRFDHDDSAA